MLEVFANQTYDVVARKPVLNFDESRPHRNRRVSNNGFSV